MLGPGLLTVLVVGDILGAGIYILVAEVGVETGGLVWLPFLVALALATLTGASYVELVAADPHASGSARWVEVAYRRPAVTFLVGFTVAASAVSTSAAVSRAVGGQYLAALVELPAVPVAMVVVVLLSMLVWVGISESARANAAMTAVEVFGLLLVITAGVFGVFDGSADPSRLVDAGPEGVGALELVGPVALAFFAYFGFEDVVHLAEEVRDPGRSFPRAVFGGLAVVGCLYMAVTLSAAALVPPGELARTDAPLVAAVERGPIPVPGTVFSVIAIVAVTNTALIALTTASRQVYGMAEQGAVPDRLGRVGRRRTPTAAIGGVAVVVALLAVTGGVRELADTTVVLLLAVFTVVNVTVLVLRRRSVARGSPPQGFRSPTIVPVLGAVSSVGLLTERLFAGGRGLYLRLAVLLGIGLLLYALAHRGAAVHRS